MMTKAAITSRTALLLALTTVSSALGNTDLPACQVGDANYDSQIGVDEILSAVNNVLNWCQPA
jgi:hypothetical protein